MKYKFIVISDEPQHPVPRLQVECKLRNDIPEDIKDYIMSLKSEYIQEGRVTYLYRRITNENS